MFNRERIGRARSPEIEYDALTKSEPGLKSRLVSIEACPPIMVRARNLGGNAPGSRNRDVARPAGTQRPKLES